MICSPAMGWDYRISVRRKHILSEWKFIQSYGVRFWRVYSCGYSLVSDYVSILYNAYMIEGNFMIRWELAGVLMASVVQRSLDPLHITVFVGAYSVRKLN